jgi:outer membrane protein OmpA-like peptidoglycan-associated protein
MKTPRFLAALSILFLLFLGTTPSFAASDEYDDSQSNPLRVVAYLVYPAAFLIEWTVFRPFHWLVSATEPQEEIFGHTPHPPLFAEPQPEQDYGMPKKVPMKPMDTQKPQAQTQATQEPTADRVRVVEVPVEKVVYKEVPKIVEVEKIVFPDVAFRFDSAELTDLGKGKVYLAAQKLKEKNDIAVVIEGYTDDVGSEEYNQRLGLRRARAVMAELTAQGIDAERISAVSQGETKPLINQPTPWARAVNRRVEFQVRGQ